MVIPQKKKLRQAMLCKRLALSPKEITTLSEQICRKLESLDVVSKAAVIFLTYPIKNEVDLRPFISAALSRGQKIVLPRCRRDGLSLVELLSPQGPFSPDIRGIPAPGASGRVNEKEVSVLLLPGLAFDHSGTRLGYGAGMLDALSRRLKNAPRLGICYHFQLLPTVPSHKTDEKVETIVTEKDIHLVARSS